MRRIADIYRNAKNVVVWLGESSMQSRAGMKTISAMLTPGFFSQTPRHDWSVVSALLQNEWFSRRWVVQEIVSAKDATLIVGEDALDWGDFADAVELFETNLDDISQQLRKRTLRHKYDTDPLGSLNHSGALELMRTIRELKPSAGSRVDTPRRTLEWLLTSLKAFQTADPRDTVYALLAIASDGGSITPNYEKSLLEVVMDVMTHVINQSSSLDILLRYWFPVSQGHGASTLPLSTFSSKATLGSNYSSAGIAFGTKIHAPLQTGQSEVSLKFNGIDTERYFIQQPAMKSSPLCSRTKIAQHPSSYSRFSSSIDSGLVTQVTDVLLSSVGVQKWDNTLDSVGLQRWDNLIDSVGLQKWDNIPKWIKRVDGLPFGDPRARSTRRINGNPLVGLPGEGHYSATKGKIAQVRLGNWNMDLCTTLLVSTRSYILRLVCD